MLPDRLDRVSLHSLSIKSADATSFIKDQLDKMVDLLTQYDAGHDWAREEADFLDEEMDQAFRELYLAAPAACDPEIATRIRKDGAT